MPLIGFLSWLGYEGYVNYTGYCKAEERFLSNEEFINVAILNELYLLQKRESLSPDEKKTYRDQYLVQNPECCSVFRNWEEYFATNSMRSSFSSEGFYHPNFVGKVLGDASHLVMIKHDTKTREKKHQIDLFFTMLGNCGQVKNY